MSTTCISTTLFCVLLFGIPSVATKEISNVSSKDVAQETEKRGTDRQLKVGMFQPLMCEGFYRHYKDRRAREIVARVGQTKLGFFTPVNCKPLEQWLNNQKYVRMMCKKRNSDCYEILQCKRKYGREARSGVYWIKPKHYKPIQVYCDMHTDGGGWTVFHNRMDGSENFYRTWSEYKKGFGKLQKEFWLGNDFIHAIVSQGHYSLRVNLEDHAGNKRYAFYKNFNVGNEKQKYKLSIGGYSGNSGNSMISHNNQYFSTKDQDNDIYNGKCAIMYIGAWWYHKCYDSNLNGRYYNKNTDDSRFNCWERWPGGKSCTNMKRSQLEVRWVRKFKY